MNKGRLLIIGTSFMIDEKILLFFFYLTTTASEVRYKAIKETGNKIFKPK